MAAEYKTIVSLVRDRPGVLTRIASMFRRRNFNIISLAVGQSETKGLSRMTFVVDGDDATIDQVIKQLRKLIDVVSVEPIGDRTMVARELALIRVTATSATRSEITQIAEIFRANVIDVAPDSLIIEVTGDEDKVQSLKSLLESFGVREMIRTGRVAMERGLALDSRRNGKTTIPQA
ncbi:MAG: acetolactate synthase small subunit [SAR202 cluster bacterium]|nr:acetolactate synthase small subunit [SAR202 cluster bacterium]